MEKLSVEAQKQALENHLISIGIDNKFLIKERPKGLFILANKEGSFFQSKLMNYDQFNFYLFGFYAGNKIEELIVKSLYI